MTSTDFPRLRFTIPFDDRAAFEAEARGYWGHSEVELEDGSLHPVIFYDAVRLAQDLEEEASHGKPFLAEKGLIVLQTVTLVSMQQAVSAIDHRRFFG